MKHCAYSHCVLSSQWNAYAFRAVHINSVFLVTILYLWVLSSTLTYPIQPLVADLSGLVGRCDEVGSPNVTEEDLSM